MCELSLRLRLGNFAAIGTYRLNLDGCAQYEKVTDALARVQKPLIGIRNADVGDPVTTHADDMMVRRNVAVVARTIVQLRHLASLACIA